jgi:hypothetical protein
MNTFTALIHAGTIKEDDDRLMYVQGLTLEAATAMTEWLAVATDGRASVRHIDPAKGLDVTISRVPEDAQWRDMNRSPEA